MQRISTTSCARIIKIGKYNQLSLSLPSPVVARTVTRPTARADLGFDKTTTAKSKSERTNRSAAN
jgi:hypothetical protein